MLYGLIKIPIVIHRKIKEKKPNNYNQDQHQEDIQTKENIEKEQPVINNAYERKFLMSYNEKDQFYKIKSWADKKDLIVFSKVRLLDLITPIKSDENYKVNLWKIQAKHVDFVICDKRIRVKAIIEINDNSHNQQDRKERDIFVNDALSLCGYKVLTTYNVTEEELNNICGYMSTLEEQNQP